MLYFEAPQQRGLPKEDLNDQLDPSLCMPFSTVAPLLLRSPPGDGARFPAGHPEPPTLSSGLFCSA